MDENLRAVMELSRDPMLVVEEGKITYANAAAGARFPQLAAGSPASALPEHIFAGQSEQFVTSALIDECRCTVSACRCGSSLALALVCEEERSGRGFLSDGLMSSLLSALFNLRLAAGRVAVEAGDQADEKLKLHLAILQRSCFSVNRMLTNLNTALTLQEKSAFLSAGPVDLAALCSDIVASVSALTRDRCAALEFSTPLPELMARVDAQKVERLILNLLSNSLKYTPTDGRVLLRLTRSGDNAILSVDDNGCGIAPDVLKTVFSRHEQRITGGSLCREVSGGLGLGVARGIAELHGGALIIESREGEGTSVRVLLPLSCGSVQELSCESTPYVNGGMNLILTELSDVLGSEFYKAEYLD